MTSLSVSWQLACRRVDLYNRRNMGDIVLPLVWSSGDVITLVGRINVENGQYCLWTRKPSQYVTSYQVHLAWPSLMGIGAVSTGNGYGNRYG